MTGSILPPQMTQAEQRGFSIAMGCVASWGRQLVSSAYLPGPNTKGEDLAQIEVLGRQMQICAAALDRRLGLRPGTPIPPETPGP